MPLVDLLREENWGRTAPAGFADESPTRFSPFHRPETADHSPTFYYRTSGRDVPIWGLTGFLLRRFTRDVIAGNGNKVSLPKNRVKLTPD